MPVERYIVVVFGKRPAEEMAAFCIGDKIQIVGFRRRQRGPQRRASRIRNRTRRKPNMPISVVRRIKGQVPGL